MKCYNRLDQQMSLNQIDVCIYRMQLVHAYEYLRFCKVGYKSFAIPIKV